MASLHRNHPMAWFSTMLISIFWLWTNLRLFDFGRIQKMMFFRSYNHIILVKNEYVGLLNRGADAGKAHVCPTGSGNARTFCWLYCRRSPIASYFLFFIFQNYLLLVRSLLGGRSFLCTHQCHSPIASDRRS